MRSLHARFMGNGNCWIDNKYRGWKMKCSGCGREKIIASRGRQSLPPNVIVKKMMSAGWFLGNKPTDDCCDKCRRKPVQSSIAVAKKAVLEFTAPMAEVNGHRIPFSEIILSAKSLPVEQIKELIKILREALPVTEPKPKAPKPAPEPESDYQKWLNEQV